MIANTAVYGKSLDKNISKIFFDSYAEYRKEFTDIAKIENAPAGKDYTEAELSPLGALRELPEGTAIQFDFPVEGNEKTLTYTQFGLGFQVTPIMMKDDLHQNFMKMPGKLSKSASFKPDAEFFDLFNSGFSSATAWDSNYIFSSRTTLKSGTTINNAASAALSETSLRAAFEYYDNLVDEAGFPLLMVPRKLVVPTELRWTADQLMKNRMENGSANRDMNLVNSENGSVDSYSVHKSRWLTSATAWFLLADEHDFRFYWKEKPTLESYDDFHTGNALFKVTERFGTGCFGYKGAYGSTGA